MEDSCKVEESEPSEQFKYKMTCKTLKGVLSIGTIDRRLSESLAQKFKDGDVGLIDFEKVEDTKSNSNRLVIEIRKI